jgi:hypothetical protein
MRKTLITFMLLLIPLSASYAQEEGLTADLASNGGGWGLIVRTDTPVQFKQGVVAEQDKPRKSEPQELSVPRVTVEKAKKAADEVEAARVLIQAEQAEIAAIKTLLSLQKEKIALEEAVISLKDKQIESKDVIISVLTKENGVLQKENAKLQKSNKRLRKIGTVLGSAVAVLAVIIFH